MRRKAITGALALCVGLLASAFASATMVQQMNLGELATNADKIFRGTVMRVEGGTVTAGGTELATTRYTIRVSEMIKGQLADISGKPVDYIEITMLGSLKSPAKSGNLQRLSAFTPPQLRPGGEYLLFTSRESQIGLSMTIGVGQGAFQFVDGENVLNEAKNAGLFRDMDSQGLPQRGPIPYGALSDRIRSIVGN